MRDLLRTIREYNCHLSIHPRLTRDGVLYKMSIKMLGDAYEMCSAVATHPEDFESGARSLLVEFHRKAEEIDLYPVD